MKTSLFSRYDNRLITDSSECVVDTLEPPERDCQHKIIHESIDQQIYKLLSIFKLTQFPNRKRSRYDDGNEL